MRREKHWELRKGFLEMVLSAHPKGRGELGPGGTELKARGGMNRRRDQQTWEPLPWSLAPFSPPLFLVAVRISPFLLQGRGSQVC